MTRLWIRPSTAPQEGEPRPQLTHHTNEVQVLLLAIYTRTNTLQRCHALVLPSWRCTRAAPNARPQRCLIFFARELLGLRRLSSSMALQLSAWRRAPVVSDARGVVSWVQNQLHS
jgi:hypothetical protein